MADKTTYFANFDGDDINGKRYALGEEIADDVDAGTLAFLANTGRITTTAPDTGAVKTWPALDEKPLGDMTRDELEAAARASLNLSKLSDEELREGIERHRNAGGAEADDTPPAPPFEPREGDDELIELLKVPVQSVVLRIAEIDDVAKVERIRELEANGQNRQTALAGIDARIAALKSSD